ncbi:hypothetical protein BS615_19550 (plasmid) [Acinetobacter baumannii]|nr:hypothetical protein BS615_19550 [Acinetobacter baumannii]
MDTPPLALNESVKCPKCESRNLILFINKKISDVIHFNNGDLDFKQHNAVNIFIAFHLNAKIAKID